MYFLMNNGCMSYRDFSVPPLHVGNRLAKLLQVGSLDVLRTLSSRLRFLFF